MATEMHNLQELRRSASLASKVFIQRDYSDGTMCQFQMKFPPELDSRIYTQQRSSDSPHKCKLEMHK
ncbi:golgin subfamily A member 7B [Pelobates cultripes]|uniref:Golgin subfamily A member 7B n=1 Tax=Pelobates cultripes TaxID=61616 RepID=A0AAD1WRH4_PELCU|nr:golgin subfamily A member 7B [Pelobates cultripes]